MSLPRQRSARTHTAPRPVWPAEAVLLLSCLAWVPIAHLGFLQSALQGRATGAAWGLGTALVPMLVSLHHLLIAPWAWGRITRPLLALLTLLRPETRQQPTQAGPTATASTRNTPATPLTRPRRAEHARWLAVGLLCLLGLLRLLGLAFGIGQLLRGAQDPSHTLWSAWLCWVICSVAAQGFAASPWQRRLAGLMRRAEGQG